MFAYIHTKEHFSCLTQWRTKPKNKLPPEITSIGLWVPWCEKALLTNHHHQSVPNTSKSKSESMPESNSWKLKPYLESWMLQHCRLDPNMILGKYFTKRALPFPKLDMQRRNTHSSGSGDSPQCFQGSHQRRHNKSVHQCHMQPTRHGHILNWRHTGDEDKEQGAQKLSHAGLDQRLEPAASFRHLSRPRSASFHFHFLFHCHCSCKAFVSPI